MSVKKVTPSEKCCNEQCIFNYINVHYYNVFLILGFLGAVKDQTFKRILKVPMKLKLT